MTSLDIRPLGPACGAEVVGARLGAVTDEQMAILRRTLAERGVLFFRDQELTPEQQIAFARRWGDIDVNAYFPANGLHPEIAEVRKDENQKVNIGGGWHTDHSYDQVPAMGSVLLARETPPSGGDTLFASTYAAYDSLSDGLKKTLNGLRAVHSADHIYGLEGAYSRTDRTDLALSDISRRAVHPMVITHPESGRKALYVNPGFTLGIEGWAPEESKPLLDYLYAQTIRPEHQCRLQWAPGSLAVWDNRSTWHFALNDYQGHRRLMHRITISGSPLH